MSRVFLLSPAHSGGKRAAMLTRSTASFELARQVQIGVATLGDVFAFCSGLYFRGKLAYARHFVEPPQDAPGVLIITTSRGLVPPDTAIGLRDLAEFAAVAVDSEEPRFTEPLKATARSIASAKFCEFVLLGSVATGKYLDTLLPILKERLLYPEEFAGRGDMSRGALLLRAVTANQELCYAPARPVKQRSAMPRGEGAISPKMRR
jgi:hypothetical protein